MNHLKDPSIHPSIHPYTHLVGLRASPRRVFGKCPTPLLCLRILEKAGNWPPSPECADGSQVLLPRAVFGNLNNTSYHFPAAAGRRPSESRDGRPPISMARGGGRRLQAKGGAPDPARRSSGDQSRSGVPSRPNVRPSHSSSTWVAPRRQGGRDRLFLCERHRLAPSNRPGSLTLKTHARSMRGSRAAGGPSRFEAQGCAAEGTADSSPELWRAVTSASMWE
jgi:hypothetical protein